MKRTYINESHRKYSEALQKEIAEMSEHPLSAEQKETQMRRNRQLSRERAENDRLKANDEFLTQFAGKWLEPETSEGED